MTVGLPGGPGAAAVTHRRYVSHGDAHYAGSLVDGAYVLGLFGDIATDLCIQHDGDEGLLASYSNVTFHASVQAGDVLEVRAWITRIGNRSRDIRFEAHVAARSSTASRASAALALDSPLLVVSADGTVVVPAPETSSRT